MGKAIEYIPLASSPEEDAFVDGNTALRPLAGNRNRLIIWTSIGAICSSVLSMVLFASATLSISPAGQNQPVHRPSMYINFDRISANLSMIYPPITNYPSLVFQLQTSDASRLMREEGRSHDTPHGYVFPEDRHIIVSAETSTVVQFRHLDHGMERCTLEFSIPVTTTDFDPAATLSQAGDVDVWVLDAPDEISPYTPNTWKHAPKRIVLLATLPIPLEAPSVSDEFICPSGGWTTLELVCSASTPDCMVDFWQAQSVAPAGGVVLVQRPSIPAQGAPA